MAVTEVVTWTPTTTEDTLFKEAVAKLNTSNDNVVVQTPKGQPNRFILQSKGYYGQLQYFSLSYNDVYSSLSDLQAYVMTGNTFPNNNGDFERRMPKTSFKKLTDIDPDIYEVCSNHMRGSCPANLPT